MVDLVWVELVEEFAVDLLDFFLAHGVFEAKDGHGCVFVWFVWFVWCLNVNQGGIH